MDLIGRQTPSVFKVFKDRLFLIVLFRICLIPLFIFTNFSVATTVTGTLAFRTIVVAVFVFLQGYGATLCMM